MPIPPLQAFVDLVGPPIKSAWLNAVDILATTIFEQPITKAAARTALTNDAPLEVLNGGTGGRTIGALVTALSLPSSIGVDSGVVNAYVFTHSGFTGASLSVGTSLKFTPLSTNTGPSTLNADGTGVIGIVRANGTALTGGELSSLGPVILQYNGTAWQIVSTAGAQPGFERTAAEIAAGVTPTNYAIGSHLSTGFVIPERYGAVGNGISSDLTNGALDTTAINNSITLANATSCPILLSRAYIALPGTSQTGAASYNCAFVLKSGVTFLGHNGGSIKIQDNYSTNGSPKEMAMFSISSGAVSNVSWIGLKMDMNGANNLMSPSRPASYNRFNHAAIMANGPNGIINDARIEDCTLQNTAGVCYVVCQLVAAGTTPTMGVRWTIKNNLFLNGGSDTDDLTALYAWAEDVVIDGNIFWQDNPPHTVGLTGGATGFEIHGARARAVNNQVRFFKNGSYVSSNFTNKTVDVVVANNDFYTTDYGAIFYRQQVGGMTEIDNVIIANNTFYFDTNTTSIQWSDGIASRVCIGFEGQYGTNQLAVNNIRISGNIAIDNTFGSTALRTMFVRWDSPSNVASNVCSNLSITDNQAIGFNQGVVIITNATNTQGLTEVSNNQFISMSPDSGALYDVVGIEVNATGGFKTLVIDGNQFIDERASPSFNKGIILTTGTITDLFYGKQTYKGLTGASYSEAGGITITNRKGGWVNMGATGAIATGTAVGHGLPATPTSVLLQALDATPTTVYPSAIGTTQFTINFAGGGSHAFAWTAFIGSPFP